jgi:epoxide hydrolase
MSEHHIGADPMVVAVREEQVASLRNRLAQTCWPNEIEGSDWDYGTSLAYMRELSAYWQAEYDWREHERAINSLAHFRVRIEGLGVHFIDERG